VFRVSLLFLVAVAFASQQLREHLTQLRTALICEECGLFAVASRQCIRSRYSRLQCHREHIKEGSQRTILTKHSVSLLAQLQFLQHFSHINRSARNILISVDAEDTLYTKKFRVSAAETGALRQLSTSSRSGPFPAII
jgi:hypothetical protein